MTHGSQRAADVVVTGHSLPALQSALDLAEVGLSVVVTADRDEQHTHARPERDPEGVLAAFMRRVAAPIDGTDADENLGLLPVSGACDPPLLIDPAGSWAPQAKPNVLGMPAVVLSAESLRLLGTASALRAYLDRVMPLLTVGKTKTVGKLVRKRLGSGALRRLVEPHIAERFGRIADEVDVAIAAPGLNEALSRAGALSSAVLAYSDRNEKREALVAPAQGWAALRAALLHRLELYGATIDEASIISVREHEGGWISELAGGGTVASRAMVFDMGRSAATLEQAIEPLLNATPGQWRVHAEIDIELPTFLRSAASALRSEGPWAVRIERSGTETARVTLQHKVLELEAAAAAREVTPGHELDGVLDDLGLRPVAGADWKCFIAVAPFASIAQRDLAQHTLETLVTEHPTLLPVGRALHGDDLGAALQWSQRQSVVLRRRLLGLEV